MNPLIWIIERNDGDCDFEQDTVYLGYVAEEASKAYAEWFITEYWPYNATRCSECDEDDEPFLGVLIFENVDGRPQVTNVSQAWHEAYWDEWRRQRAERKPN